MSATRALLARAGGPLTAHEFTAAFEEMLAHAPLLRDELSSPAAAGMHTNHSRRPFRPDAEAPPRPIALAVSGGPDSLALAALAAAALGRSRLVALFVDHGMQAAGVTEDAGRVAALMARLGIPMRTLRLGWRDGLLGGLHVPMHGRVQEVLRFRRYAAMRDACAQLGARLLLTGHNLDDDVATMLYRMASCSGVDGLAGMRPVAAAPVGVHVAEALFSDQLSSSAKAHDSEDAAAIGTGVSDCGALPTRSNETGHIPKRTSARARSTEPTISRAFTPESHAADGVLVGRPLLGTPKARLLETCLAAFGHAAVESSVASTIGPQRSDGGDLGKTGGLADVPWVCDESNADTQYRRNAIMAAVLDMQRTGTVAPIGPYPADPADSAASDTPALLGQTSHAEPDLEGGSHADETVDLCRMLAFFKDVRRDMHKDVVNALRTSALWDHANGDATLVMNTAARSWMAKRPVATRVLAVLAQMAAAKPFPPRMRRIGDIRGQILSALAEQDAAISARSAQRRGSRRDNARQPTEAVQLDSTRRIALPQMVTSGATFLSLSRKDAMLRIQASSFVDPSVRGSSSAASYGPSFAVLSQPPVGIRAHTIGCGARALSVPPGRAVLWDGRFWLARTRGADEDVVFSVSHATPADVRAFEEATRGRKECSVARRAVLQWAARTPGTHYYQVPVVRVGEYVAFPTLGAEYPAPRFGWAVSCEGHSVVVDRFKCLP